MAKKTTTPYLFIVESPNKVATIKKYLGKEYIVAASVGHCFRLPKKNFIDIADGFKLRFELDPAKKDVLNKIESYAASCDIIYLATDQDTEGSCISWHIYKHLYKKFKDKKQYLRVNLKEITKSGIEAALKSCYPVTDLKEAAIVDAGHVRRIEDRFTGFRISPLAFIHVQEGTSAGRVQSPALKIIVDRHREIEEFKPEVYYDIYADVFPKATTDIFTVKYTQKVQDEKTAEAIVAGSKEPVVIEKVIRKSVKSKSPPPFVTETLLASASTILGWKVARTTNVAQSLFQSGLITYIRCDNTTISPEGRKMLVDYVKANFITQYHVKKLPDYNLKTAKLEHECIRPTDLNATPGFAAADDRKLYELIKNRFIAAGLPPAEYDNTSIDVKIGTHPYQAKGSILTFDGYLKAWNYNTKTDTVLPNIDEAKTELKLRDAYHQRKETKPPSRYKDATLLGVLRKKGIGKPSTLKSIIDTLEKRQYVVYEKKALVPTTLGLRLNDFLAKYFSKVIDDGFTARVESQQEDVEAGKLSYQDAVSEFYTHLKEQLKEAQLNISSDKKDDEQTAYTCPSCNENLLLKKINRKEGTYFYSCSGYLDKSCAATFSMKEDGSPVKREAEVLQKCPGHGCGGDLIKRVNKRTKQVFYACSNWSSGCKIAANEDGEIREAKVVKKLGKKCTKCGKGDMVERTSRAGDKFAACNAFPRCKYTESID